MTIRLRGNLLKGELLQQREGFLCEMDLIEVSYVV